jgi:hypothetical protein
MFQQMTASIVRVIGMSFPTQWSRRISAALPLFSLLTILIPQLVWAQTPSDSILGSEPLETELLDKRTPPRDGQWITANTISPSQLANPSLWWAEEQFDQFNGKLIQNWIAYPKKNKKRVDLIVNRQLWSLLDYLGRYSFLSRYGAAARDYQYDVRVFNEQADPLAAYTCNYDITPPACQLILSDSFGRDNLPVRPPKP